MAALTRELLTAPLRALPCFKGSTPRPAPSCDLQQLLASMQSSWGAQAASRRRPPVGMRGHHARTAQDGCLGKGRDLPQDAQPNGGGL